MSKYPEKPGVYPAVCKFKYGEEGEKKPKEDVTSHWIFIVISSLTIFFIQVGPDRHGAKFEKLTDEFWNDLQSKNITFGDPINFG